jgi:hypothetical protein
MPTLSSRPHPSLKQIFALAFLSTFVTSTAFILPKLLKIISTWPTSISEAIPKIGGLDRTLMFQAGVSMTNGSVKSSKWIFELWPPGIPLMNASAIKLQLNMHLYSILFFYIVALVWSFLIYRTFVGNNLKWLHVFIGVGIFQVLLIEPFISNNFFLEGLFNSDALGALLGLISLTYLIDYITKEQRSSFYRFAVFASLASYFRLTWYTFFFCIVLIFVVLEVRKMKSDRNLRLIAVATILFISITFPMRVYNYVNFDTNPINWTKYGKFLVLSPWVPEEKWKNTRDDGTGAYALCALEPKFCEKVQKLETVPDVNDSEITKITIISWLKNWPQLTKFEVPYIARGYFSPALERIPNDKFNFNFGNVLSFILLLLSIRFVPPVHKREIRWLQLLCTSSFVLPLIFLHTETRYLLPLKLLPLIFVPYLLTDGGNFLKRLKLKIQSQANKI